jgi:MerR family transcriptional regulator, thiopeptide resistance regulator
MKTITVLARRFGLSRTTLLYYDRIGLLRASYRTQAEARLYSDAEEARLARIVTYRRAGVPLAAIRAILEAKPAKVNRALETQLAARQRQIDGLKAQQRLIVAMLKDAVLRGESPARTKDEWVALLKACAFSEDDMRRWHTELERDDPRAHARFLRRIGLPPEAAERVRAAARGEASVPAHAGG